MHIARLELSNFRNHEKLLLSFAPGITAIVGPNGRGKTNIVEAVHYLAVHASHRVASDAPLIRHGCEIATMGATVIRHDRAANFLLELGGPKGLVVELNGVRRKSRDGLGHVRTAVFSPEDLELVKGDPAARRRFLDELLVQLFPRLSTTRSAYEKAVRQRNTLLKSVGRKPSNSARATLSAWDEQLVEHGVVLTQARIDLVNQLKPRVLQHGETLAAGTEPMTISYVSNWAKDNLYADFENGLAARRDEELQRGMTLVGPHRDDLLLELSGKPAKGYASHGQAWSFALALRLASFAVLRELDDDPILILDDVFAELDTKRRERLLAALDGVEQTLITAAVAQDLPSGLIGTRIDLPEVRDA